MLIGATIHFYCLSDESHFSNICTLLYVIIECTKLNWLCKHMKMVRSSQVAIIVLNWVKQSFSLWVSLKFIKVSLKYLFIVYNNLDNVSLKISPCFFMINEIWIKYKYGIKFSKTIPNIRFYSTARFLLGSNR